jgi:thymidylate kinase
VAGEYTKIISFSGIDGAGKSTQICALESWLAESGLRTLTLTMWNDIVVGTRFRETASRYAFRGDQGIGTPENPLYRRDKNVTSLPLTIVRCCLYLADAAHLHWWVKKLQRKLDFDVIIFDRYIYDELANLPLNRPLARRFIRFLLRIAPQPDVAFLVDAIPEAARARKPEYPVEFLRRNREAYLTLREIVGNMVVVCSGSVEDMEQTIQVKLRSKVSNIRDSRLIPIRR